MNCPVCSAPNVKITDEFFECAYCGSIQRHDLLICPSCREPNPPESEECSVCGEPLTLVSQVMMRHSDLDSGPYRLRQAREQAARIKESEERSSQQRIHDLEEEDRKRIQAAREAEMARQKEQSQLFKFTCAFIAILFLVILILTIRSAFAQ
jgi:hypothetical protein